MLLWRKEWNSLPASGIYCKRPMTFFFGVTSKEGECLNVKRRKNAVSPAMYPVGLAVLFLIILSVKKDLQISEKPFGDVIKRSMAQEFSESLTGSFLPILSFAHQQEKGSNPLLEEQITGMVPLYGYYRKMEEDTTETRQGEYLLLADILPAEEYLQSDNIQEENTGFQEEQRVVGKEPNSEQPIPEDSLQELLRVENEEALFNLTDTGLAEQSSAFVRHELQSAVDLQAFTDYENLVKNFYTIDGNTMAGSDQLDISKLMGRDMTISMESDGPQILIYHTHSQEAFADSVPGDEATSIVGVGNRLSEILSAEYGYEVLHHKGKYDVDARDDAYAKSLPDIEKVLAENPSIQVIIDLHRDSMPEETRLVMDLDGRPTARFMFFNGLSRTRKTGNIAYLYNENQEDNLAFSFQMQLKAVEYYPGLTRKIYLKGYRYNMHLRPRTTLIELGAQNNTVEEAMNACDPLAHIIHMVLSGEGE